MNFLMRESLPSKSPIENTVVLQPSDWDDYSNRTEFTLYFAISGGEFRLIGTTKILARYYPEDKKYKRSQDALDEAFRALDLDDFCSLGQSIDYYTRLGEYELVGKELLKALNDICFVDEQSWWKRASGFRDSLLRYPAAHIARREAKARFEQRKFLEDIENQIDYQTTFSHISFNPKEVSFKFNGNLEVPGRLNVIIGKNGVGKTSLLAGIAKWYSRPTFGETNSFRPDFSQIIVVTFNSFDSAFLKHNEPEYDVKYVGRTPLSHRGRRFVEDLRNSTKDEKNTEWFEEFSTNPDSKKNLRELLDVFVFDDYGVKELTSLAKDKEGWGTFVKKAFDDPDLPDLLIKDPEDALKRMSAGQKVLTRLYCGLFLQLDRKALVLIDEPESHLHPSLIARFIKNFNEMLEQRSAFAIIATHSPIVVQETPSRFVTVLERDDEQTDIHVSHPRFETFGESIDNITERLFDTDFSSSHWKYVLKKFVKRGLSLEEVNKNISGKQLSMLARTYYRYHKKEDNE